MKFNTDNPFFRFMGTLVSFTALNLSFLLTCLPIFTIGTALASLFNTTLSYIENEDLPLTKTYFKNFKLNFKSTTIIFLITAAVIAIISFNIAFWQKFNSVVSQPIFVVLIVILALIAFVVELLFPLAGRFQNSIKQTFKNAVLMVLPNFFKVLLLLAIDASAFGLGYVSEFARVMYIIFGLAFIAYVKSFLLKNIFKKYGSNE